MLWLAVALALLAALLPACGASLSVGDIIAADLAANPDFYTSGRHLLADTFNFTALNIPKTGYQTVSESPPGG